MIALVLIISVPLIILSSSSSSSSSSSVNVSTSDASKVSTGTINEKNETFVTTDKIVEHETFTIIRNAPVFVTTNTTAIDEFVAILEVDEETVDVTTETLDQLTGTTTYVTEEIIVPGVGLGVEVALLDSDNTVIPQSSNFLKIPVLDAFVSNPTSASLVDSSGNDISLGRIQVIFKALTTSEENLTITGNYQVLLNGDLLAEKELYGKGRAVGNTLDLSTDLDASLTFTFEDEDVSQFIVGEDDNVFLNNFEIRVQYVEVVMGDFFETKQYIFNGDFPAYQMRFTHDGTTNTVRDFSGAAIQIPLSNSGVTSCGYGSNRYQTISGYERPPPYYPAITVKDLTGKTVLDLTSEPHRDNGRQCTTLIGLQREAVYNIIVNDEPPIQVTTPSTTFIYEATCQREFERKEGFNDYYYTSFRGQSCTSNFGWDHCDKGKCRSQ